MNVPRRREVERFIHVDSRDFNGITKSKYHVIFGTHIPVQDYNNVIKLELKAFMSKAPTDPITGINEDYVFFKIKNVDGKLDSTSSVNEACTVCYFDTPTANTKRPIYFGGNSFEFNPPIAKLSKLDIEIVTHDGEPCVISDVGPQSFLLKITYIEGNMY